MYGVEAEVVQRPRPRGIDGWLQGLLRANALKPKDLEVVQERAARLAAILENDAEMGVAGTLIGGSVGKGTANAPAKDLDLYLELDRRVWRDAGNPPDAGQLLEEFVQRLRHALRWHFEHGHLRVERQRHSVGVVYLAEGSANIDVVPMLTVPRAPGICVIPRRTDGAYVTTSVARQLELIGRLDGPGRHLREGIRLLKLWSRPREPRLPSYALEILAMYVTQRGCEPSAPGVFWAVLDLLGEDKLTTPVHVEGWIGMSKQRFPGPHQPCVIMDPAVVGNNVLYSLRRVEGEDIANQARFTMGRLRCAGRLLLKDELEDAQEAFEDAWEPAPAR